MKKRLLITLISAFSGFIFLSGQTPVNLRCEHLTNPLGIDSPTPRLSWMIDDSREGAAQTAYQIFVSENPDDVADNRGNIWNSQRVGSDEILATYAGNELKPFTRYYWKVNVWDKDGAMASSEVNFFETGVMNIKNWKGAWIGDGRDIHYKPAPYFRKVFESNKTIKSMKIGFIF